MRVSALTIYPVKGCRGIAVEQVRVDALGFVGDRRFLIVTEDGTFLTQRTIPRLALIETALSESSLRLAEPEFGAIDVPFASEFNDVKLRSVRVWNDSGLLAEDCGEAAHTWLSSVLGQRACLVRIGRDYKRFVHGNPADPYAFADGYPFLLISQASLADLNTRLESAGSTPVPMNRFRPNIVVEGCPAFAEDSWGRVRIGDLTFRSGGSCTRCIVTTTDQTTGARGKEPLKTLATYRRDPRYRGEIVFGENLVHEVKSGLLRVGDPVSKI